MIKITMRLGGDLLEVIVRGNELLFYDTNSQMTTTIEGVRLSKAGVIKEFPDLKDDPEWKKKAIDRFKKHMRKMENEIQKVYYIKKELQKHGYEPLLIQRAGWRAKKLR